MNFLKPEWNGSKLKIKQSVISYLGSDSTVDFQSIESDKNIQIQKIIVQKCAVKVNYRIFIKFNFIYWRLITEVILKLSRRDQLVEQRKWEFINLLLQWVRNHLTAGRSIFLLKSKWILYSIHNFDLETESIMIDSPN